LVKISIQLLDRDGNVLVRLKDFVSKPFRAAATQATVRDAVQPEEGNAQEDVKAALQSFVPVWSAVRPEASTLPAESARVLLVGSDRTQLDWVRQSWPASEFLELIPASSVEAIGQQLAGRAFDQLLWVAPDAGPDAGGSDDLIIDRQEEGVLAVFRIVKALLQLGYANRQLQWTIVTSRTQRVFEGEPMQPAHAGIVGLVGSLAKEYPQWDLRLLDLDSLASVPARECLSLSWDKQGNVLAHRNGEWFGQGLELITAPAQPAPAYRQGGVYVVIGGAGGIGEVWSRFMIENYQANIVWIGRRNYDDAIEAKLNSLTREGRAPLYISADATNRDSLELAYQRILKTHPAIHGVVHSALVLQDRSIARMDEATFRDSLSSKVDVSVNLDSVFGPLDLDFMLFFSSIISFFKTPGQSNYAAGCTFKDSFAQTLQQRRTYPVKIMNWGYWGSVGVVADEVHNKLMAQVGLGSIEPHEGMAALQTLIGSGMGQVAFIKTVAGPAAARAGVEQAAATVLDAPATGRADGTVSSEAMSDEYVRQIITRKLSEALRMDAARIRSDAPFADYGVDSIIGIDFVQAINGALQIQLEATSLFEHSTVEQLTRYILKNWQRPVAARRAQLPPAPSAAVSYAEVEATNAAATRNTMPLNRPSPSMEPTEQMTSDHIRQIVAGKLSEALRMDLARIRNNAPFADYGVDSIIGIDFVQAINAALQIRLEATSLFEHSTVDQLTQYILKTWQPQIAAGQLAQARGASPASSSSIDETPREVDALSGHRFLGTGRLADARDIADTTQESHSESLIADPIAIIGMSGRFAESESLEAFWQNLAQGKDLVTPVSRWSAADCVTPESAGRAHCSHGSFVDSVDRFDPAFFGISAQEATYMDPQQRLFLEESWKALEDAGYAGNSVHEKQCGVYVGCGTSNYSNLFVEAPPPQAWWGNSQSVVPARIAYHLDLQGPAIAVDTACSSALVAIHLACQALWSRETEMALAGGVYVEATPGFHQVANRAGMLSPDGKCYSFDARANGFVPGEAIGVVVLKRLRDALKDGDSIHGVIAGTGINQDGRSNGLIAPNARAQERLERAVYDRFAIDPETIQVVEAHATATPLGDSIEHLAISRAFRASTDKKQFCAIGSVKTNIGHAGNAAGIASVLKVLLSLKHRQIPPSLHFEKANPAVDLESGPFYVNTQLKEWQVEGDHKRRAAISSFGFSGTNAHLIIEEAPAITRVAVESPGYLVVLSARTTEQLRQQVHELLALVEQTPGLSMSDLSFTLFAGRTHFTQRLSCVARSQEDLGRLFGQWLEAGAASQLFTGEIAEGRVREQVALKKFGNYCIQECRTATDAASYLENLAAIADLYVQGYALDFDALFPGDARRIPLPTYPFARERYWIDAVPVTATRSLTIAGPQPSRDPKSPRVNRRSQRPTFTGGDDDLRAWLQDELTQLVTECIDIAADDVSPDKVLLDLGFDSIGLTKFASAINEKYGLNLTPVLFFDYPSLGAIATHLSEQREEEIRRCRDAAPATHAPAAETAVKETPVTGVAPQASSPRVARPSIARRRRVENEPV
ncbi:MAG: Beta-ketoacyl synthase, partial [Acidobacteria bacterium]|nr:Beta-ketoacyl synthase [Acidobacteriota bacterium]